MGGNIGHNRQHGPELMCVWLRVPLRRQKGAKCLVWAELVLRIHGQHRVGGRNGCVPIERAGWQGCWKTAPPTPPQLNAWFLGNFMVFKVHKHHFYIFGGGTAESERWSPTGEGEAQSGSLLPCKRPAGHQDGCSSWKTGRAWWGSACLPKPAGQWWARLPPLVAGEDTCFARWPES